MQAYAKKYVNLHLKFRKNKNCHVLLKLLRHHLDITLFRLSKLFILDPFLSNTLILLVLFFQIIWIVEFMRPNPRHKSAFFFSIFCCSYHFIFSFDTHNIPFFHHCSHFITLPVSCLLQE